MRLAERAMAVVNEHPDVNVRKLYAGEVAAQTGLSIRDLVGIAERGAAPRAIRAAPPRAELGENAEFVAITLLAAATGTSIAAVAGRGAVRRRGAPARSAAGRRRRRPRRGDRLADPEAREVLERAAVADVEADPEVEARNLIGAAVRRELARRGATGSAQIRETPRRAAVGEADAPGTRGRRGGAGC